MADIPAVDMQTLQLRRDDPSKYMVEHIKKEAFLRGRLEAEKQNAQDMYSKLKREKEQLKSQTVSVLESFKSKVGQLESDLINAKKQKLMLEERSIQKRNMLLDLIGRCRGGEMSLSTLLQDMERMYVAEGGDGNILSSMYNSGTNSGGVTKRMPPVAPPVAAFGSPQRGGGHAFVVPSTPPPHLTGTNAAADDDSADYRHNSFLNQKLAPLKLSSPQLKLVEGVFSEIIQTPEFIEWLGTGASSANHATDDTNDDINNASLPPEMVSSDTHYHHHDNSSKGKKQSSSSCGCDAALQLEKQTALLQHVEEENRQLKALLSSQNKQSSSSSLGPGQIAIKAGDKSGIALAAAAAAAAVADYTDTSVVELNTRNLELQREAESLTAKLSTAQKLAQNNRAKFADSIKIIQAELRESKEELKLARMRVLELEKKGAPKHISVNNSYSKNTSSSSGSSNCNHDDGEDDVETQLSRAALQIETLGAQVEELERTKSAIDTTAKAQMKVLQERLETAATEVQRLNAESSASNEVLSLLVSVLETALESHSDSPYGRTTTNSRPSSRIGFVSIAIGGAHHDHDHHHHSDNPDSAAMESADEEGEEHHQTQRHHSSSNNISSRSRSSSPSATTRRRVSPKAVLSLAETLGSEYSIAIAAVDQLTAHNKRLDNLLAEQNAMQDSDTVVSEDAQKRLQDLQEELLHAREQFDVSAANAAHTELQYQRKINGAKQTIADLERESDVLRKRLQESEAQVSIQSNASAQSIHQLGVFLSDVEDFVAQLSLQQQQQQRGQEQQLESEDEAELLASSPSVAIERLRQQQAVILRGQQNMISRRAELEQQTNELREERVRLLQDTERLREQWGVERAQQEAVHTEALKTIVDREVSYITQLRSIKVQLGAMCDTDSSSIVGDSNNEEQVELTVYDDATVLSAHVESVGAALHRTISDVRTISQAAQKAVEEIKNAHSEDIYALKQEAERRLVELQTALAVEREEMERLKVQDIEESKEELVTLQEEHERLIRETETQLQLMSEDAEKQIAESVSAVSEALRAEHGIEMQACNAKWSEQMEQALSAASAQWQEATEALTAARTELMIAEERHKEEKAQQEADVARELSQQYSDLTASHESKVNNLEDELRTARDLLSTRERELEEAVQRLHSCEELLLTARREAENKQMQLSLSSAKSEADYSRLNVEVVALQSKVALYTEQLELNAEAATAANQRAASLDDALLEVRKAHSKQQEGLSSIIAELEQSKFELQCQLSELKVSADTKTLELFQINSRVAELGEQLDAVLPEEKEEDDEMFADADSDGDAAAPVASAENAVMNASVESSVILSDLEALRLLSDTKNSELESVGAKIRKLSGLLKKQSVAATAAQESVSILQHQMEDMRHSAAEQQISLSGIVSELQQDRAVLQNEVQSLQEQLGEKAAEMERLLQQAAADKIRLAELTETLSVQQQYAQGLQVMLTESKQQHENESLVACHAEIQALTNRLKDVQITSEERQAEVVAVKERHVDEMRVELRDTKERFLALSEECTQLREEVSSLQQEKLALRSRSGGHALKLADKIDFLESELDNNKHALRYANNKVLELSTDLTDAQAAYDRALESSTEEKMALHSAVQHVQSALVTAKKELQRVKESLLSMGSQQTADCLEIMNAVTVASDASEAKNVVVLQEQVDLLSERLGHMHDKVKGHSLHLHGRIELLEACLRLQEDETKSATLQVEQLEQQLHYAKRLLLSFTPRANRRRVKNNNSSGSDLVKDSDFEVHRLALFGNAPGGEDDRDEEESEDSNNDFEEDEEEVEEDNDDMGEDTRSPHAAAAVDSKGVELLSLMEQLRDECSVLQDETDVMRTALEKKTQELEEVVELAAQEAAVAAAERSALVEDMQQKELQLNRSMAQLETLAAEKAELKAELASLKAGALESKATLQMELQRLQAEKENSPQQQQIEQLNQALVTVKSEAKHRTEKSIAAIKKLQAQLQEKNGAIREQQDVIKNLEQSLLAANVCAKQQRQQEKEEEDKDARKKKDISEKAFTVGELDDATASSAVAMEKEIVALKQSLTERDVALALLTAKLQQVERVHADTSDAAALKEQLGLMKEEFQSRGAMTASEICELHVEVKSRTDELVALRSALASMEVELGMVKTELAESLKTNSNSTTSATTVPPAEASGVLSLCVPTDDEDEAAAHHRHHEMISIATSPLPAAEHTVTSSTSTFNSANANVNANEGSAESKAALLLLSQREKDLKGAQSTCKRLTGRVSALEDVLSHDRQHISRLKKTLAKLASLNEHVPSGSKYHHHLHHRTDSHSNAHPHQQQQQQPSDPSSPTDEGTTTGSSGNGNRPTGHFDAAALNRSADSDDSTATAATGFSSATTASEMMQLCLAQANRRLEKKMEQKQQKMESEGAAQLRSIQDKLDRQIESIRSALPSPPVAPEALGEHGCEEEQFAHEVKALHGEFKQVASALDAKVAFIGKLTQQLMHIRAVIVPQSTEKDGSNCNDNSVAGGALNGTADTGGDAAGAVMLQLKEELDKKSGLLEKHMAKEQELVEVLLQHRTAELRLKAEMQRATMRNEQLSERVSQLEKERSQAAQELEKCLSAGGEARQVHHVTSEIMSRRSGEQERSKSEEVEALRKESTKLTRRVQEAELRLQLQLQARNFEEEEEKVKSEHLNKLFATFMGARDFASLEGHCLALCIAMGLEDAVCKKWVRSLRSISSSNGNIRCNSSNDKGDEVYGEEQQQHRQREEEEEGGGGGRGEAEEQSSTIAETGNSLLSATSIADNDEDDDDEEEEEEQLDMSSMDSGMAAHSQQQQQQQRVEVGTGVEQGQSEEENENDAQQNRSGDQSVIYDGGVRAALSASSLLGLSITTPDSNKHSQNVVNWDRDAGDGSYDDGCIGKMNESNESSVFADVSLESRDISYLMHPHRQPDFPLTPPPPYAATGGVMSGSTPLSPEYSTGNTPTASDRHAGHVEDNDDDDADDDACDSNNLSMTDNDGSRHMMSMSMSMSMTLTPVARDSREEEGDQAHDNGGNDNESGDDGNGTDADAVDCCGQNSI